MQAESSFQIEASQEFQVSGKSCNVNLFQPLVSVISLLLSPAGGCMLCIFAAQLPNLSDCLSGRIQRNSLAASSVGLTQI